MSRPLRWACARSRKVLSLARQIADRGLAVVLISHILPHVMELADRVIVMRHGQKVAEIADDISSDRLVALVVGVDAHDAAEDAEARRPRKRRQRPARRGRADDAAAGTRHRRGAARGRLLRRIGFAGLGAPAP